MKEKRFLSFFFAIIFVLTLIPVHSPAYAETETETVSVIAGEGEKVEETVEAIKVSATEEGAFAQGALAEGFGGGSASLAVEGNVAATSENGQATGANSVAYDAESSAAINIEGDVTTQGEGFSGGVSAQAINGATADVAVQGSVTVEGEMNDAKEDAPMADSGDSQESAAKTNDTIGVDVMAGGGDSQASAEVEQSVSVSASDGNAVGVVLTTQPASKDDTSAGSAEATIGGDITAEANNDYRSNALGVNSRAFVEGDNTVEVAGSIDVSAANDGNQNPSGGENAPPPPAASAIGVNSEIREGSSNTVTVSETITAESTGTNPVSMGVNSNVTGGSSNTITATDNITVDTITATDNITVESTGTNPTAVGVNSTVILDSTNNVSITGDITAEASGVNAAANAVSSTVVDGSANTVTVTGDLTVSASGTDTHATGTNVNIGADPKSPFDRQVAESKDSYAPSVSNVTINGDISVSAEGGASNGVAAQVRNESTSTITINGNIESVSDNSSMGVFNGASEGSTSTVTATGDVTVTGSEENLHYDKYPDNLASSHIDNDKNSIIDYYFDANEESSGVYSVSNHASDVLVEVGGIVTVDGQEGDATGVHAFSLGGGSATVQVEKDVKATGDDVTGAHAFVGGYEAKDEASAVIDIAGNVTAESNSEDGSATGILVGADHITADSTNNEIVFIGAAPQQPPQEVKIGDAGTVPPDGVVITKAENGGVDNGKVVISIGGDVTAEAKGDSTAILSKSEDSDVAVSVEGSITASSSSASAESNAIVIEAVGGSTSVSVAGDASADTNGIVINGTNDADIDILIQGTLSAAEQAVVVNEAEAANVAITVWQVDVAEGKNIVAPSADNSSVAARETAAEIESNIMYIIKLEQPKTGGSVSLDGTSKSHELDTAKEGETVTLKTSLDEGYTIVGAYNGEKTKVALLQDANGDYYVVVPKGGGVSLSVEISQKTAEASDDETSESSSGTASDTPAYIITVTDDTGVNPPQVYEVNFVPAPAPATVRGTAEDNSAIVAGVDEVLRADASVDGMPELASAAASADAVSHGVVDFGGAFLDAQEDVIAVPVPVPGAMAGVPYIVSFSDGTTVEVTCDENGVLLIPFPRDAQNMGYVVQKNPAAEFAARYRKYIDLYREFGTFADLSDLPYETQLRIMELVDSESN